MKKKNIFLTTCFFFFFVLLLLYLFTPSPPIKISSETSSDKKTDEDNAYFFEKSKERTFEKNILLLGRPGQGYSGGNLTDTIILVRLSQDQSDKKAILISLPRDLLIKIPGQENLTKINSLYQIVGIEGLKEKIQEITGFAPDHYLIVDLVVVEEIINLIDGLNIYVKDDIHDPYFPGPNYSYETFNLSAGWRYLDGPTALKYIRTRYTSPNGDFDRMARQQQVVQLLKRKVLSLNLLWNFPTYLKIFNSLKDHIETDLSIFEMRYFWQFAKEIGAEQIKSIVIDKKETELLRGDLVMFGSQPASVVYPIAGQENYNEIKNFINHWLR